MKLLNNVALGIAAVFVASSSAVHAESATKGNDPLAIISINGKTVTKDEITSFAIDLQENGVMRAPQGRALLNQYILTKLYDKIPTTASLPVRDTESTAPTKYKLVTQRALLKRDLRKSISDNVEVPRADMQKWYEQNVGKYTKPERVHALHLFMETSDDTPSSSPEKVRSRLKELKTQIDSGTSFSQMAEKYSEAASGEHGGEIGLISRRMPIGPLSKPMNIELEDAFFTLQPDKVSDVVETRHGMHLLYLTDRQTTRTPTLDDMITSGILPGALAQDRLTSAMQALIAETKTKHNAKVLPNGLPDDGVSTNTVAFNLDGKSYTLGDLVAIFGPRFESYVSSIKEDNKGISTLFDQALDDEVSVLAAIDMGLDNAPETKQAISDLESMDAATARIDAIAKAEAKVTDEQIATRYKELTDQLRQPEAEGLLLVIQAKQSTNTADMAKARDVAREEAVKVRAQLIGGEFNEVASKVPSSEDYTTTVTEIPKHVLGRSPLPMARLFDQAISGITGESGLGEVVPIGSDYAIAKLVKKYPGDPIPLETVRERIHSILENQALANVRDNMIKRLEDKGDVKFLPGAKQYGHVLDAKDDGTTSTE